MRRLDSESVGAAEHGQRSQPSGERPQPLSPVLEVRNLAKYYPIRTAFFKHGQLVAAEEVTFSIPKGETLALVGESGSGKSTVAKCILRLEEPSAGEVILNGSPLTGIPSDQLRQRRAQMQMVFQDPLDSLNPRKKVWTLVAEPLWLHGLVPRRDAREKVAELFELVGLNRDHLDRYPHQLSGGQQQRVGVARALATNPALAVLDEPTSALDVSVQAQLINLLRALQQRLQLSYLFITHDLALVPALSRRVAVMYLGHIMELGPTEVVLQRPFNPYTRALISATPVDNPWETRQRITLTGEPTSPINPPIGCRLAPRCPYALAKCRGQPIPLVEVMPGHAVRCIRFQEEHVNGAWDPPLTRSTEMAPLGEVPHEVGHPETEPASDLAPQEERSGP